MLHTSPKSLIGCTTTGNSENIRAKGAFTVQSHDIILFTCLHRKWQNQEWSASSPVTHKSFKITCCFYVERLSVDLLYNSFTYSRGGLDVFSTGLPFKCWLALFWFYWSTLRSIRNRISRLSHWLIYCYFLILLCTWGTSHSANHVFLPEPLIKKKRLLAPLGNCAWALQDSRFFKKTPSRFSYCSFASFYMWW